MNRCVRERHPAAYASLEYITQIKRIGSVGQLGNRFELRINKIKLTETYTRLIRPMKCRSRLFAIMFTLDIIIMVEQPYSDLTSGS